MNKRVYTSGSVVRKPAVLMETMLRDLLDSRELAKRIFVRDIKAQYRRSFLGIFWAFVPPLVMAGGLLMARRSGVINIGDTAIPYAAYVILGMIIWQTFTESLMAPLDVLDKNKAVLVKLNFPREALLLAKLYEILFSLSIKTILALAVFIWFDLHVDIKLVFVPFAMLSVIVFGLFIGNMLVPIGGLYTDIASTLRVVTGFWLFLTPVVYPTPNAGLFGLIVNFNPLTHLVVTTRELATASAVTNLSAFLVCVILAWGGLLISWVIYRIAMPFIIERMSA